MRVVLVHSLPGRARFRVASGRDAAGFASALAKTAGVKSASYNPRTGSILVFYDGHLTSESTILQAIKSAEAAAPVAAKTTERQKEKAAWSYIGYQIFRLIKPRSLKPMSTVVEAVPFFVEGLKSLSRLRLDVPVLDAAAVGASLAMRNIDSASTLIMF